MKNIEAIEKYIVYLIRECGLSVTLHPMERDNLITFSSLMRFNTHDNLYCTLVKSKRCAHERCLAGQRRVLDKMRRVCEPFSGVCHAGVREYVYPLKNESEIIGFISVGGYSSAEGDVCIEKLSKELDYDKFTLEKAYRALKPYDEDKERLDTLITPLCKMLELAYIRDESATESESLITRIERYVKQNYNTDVTVDDICKTFGCSRSYFSHTWRSSVGKSFREYLLDLRLDNAERLLALSSLNVTEIAFSVGFLDSNYFSNLFKKRHGVSPLVYRKSQKSTKV